jgi:ATP-binding cassette subfamily B protein
MDGDVGALSDFFSALTVGLLGALLLLAGTLGALWAENAWLALALTACSVLAVGFLAWVRRFAPPHLQAERACEADFYGYVGEVLGATEDLRAAGAEVYVRRRLIGHLRAWLPAAVRAHVWGNSMWWVSTGVGVVARTLTYGLGARYVLNGRMTLGTVFMLLTYVDQLLWGPLAGISNQLQTLQRAEASIARVRELLQATSRLRDGPAFLPGGAPAVEFRNVRFAYPRASPADDAPPSSETPVALDGVSFYLPAGRTLGLLGRTGSGKTTIGRLLYRFYDPQQGQVLLGGIELRQARLDPLRARIGLVTQDVQLLNGTLRDNLCFYSARESVRCDGAPEGRTADARLLEALERLGLERWLARFPKGLDTPLSSTTLSAGEAQLVALARVTLSSSCPEHVLCRAVAPCRTAAWLRGLGRDRYTFGTVCRPAASA